MLQEIIFRRYLAMKMIFATALAISLAASLPMCKKNEFRSYRYDSYTASDDVDSFLGVTILDKDGKRAVWFHMLDQAGNDVSSYDNARDKVGQWPAMVSENVHVWILVNRRFEIRLMAADESDDFKDTEKLKKFLMSFDLDGLSKVPGEKISPREMAKYLPKLD
jgi:hypothetical protein